MRGSPRTPKILVFEWLVGGGLLVEGAPLDRDRSLLQQGAAMRRAISEDFLAAGCDVLLPTDRRCAGLSRRGQEALVQSGAELPDLLRHLGSQADYLFLIAPESAGRLQQVLEWVEPHQDRLLSPGLEWVRLFSDKQASCDWLDKGGVPVPAGRLWIGSRDAWPPSGIDLPAVLKPNDGCGGEDLQVIGRSWAEAKLPMERSWRVECLVSGEPVSLLAIAGGGQRLLLQPTRQRFALGQLGDYVGGEMISDPESVAAIRAVVDQALQAMQGIRGMIGFDLVLERPQEGFKSKVTMIEVNPRLTSSYLGLREYYAGNLAECLLSLAQGEVPEAVPVRAGRQAYVWRVD